jgi:hypothetical protein
MLVYQRVTKRNLGLIGVLLVFFHGLRSDSMGFFMVIEWEVTMITPW